MVLFKTAAYADTLLSVQTHDIQKAAGRSVTSVERPYIFNEPKRNDVDAVAIVL